MSSIYPGTFDPIPVLGAGANRSIGELPYMPLVAMDHSENDRELNVMVSRRRLAVTTCYDSVDPLFGRRIGCFLRLFLISVGTLRRLVD